ncbi:hypothetical protein J7J90_00505 [Candidatus Micrarchaeota archaeon]|nr:hypothetical protein [Candidatus Micrarchaeota archaeon]
MYINITNYKLEQILAMECFLSQYGYESEIKKRQNKIIMKLEKTDPENVERDDVDIGEECEEIKVTLPIREI